MLVARDPADKSPARKRARQGGDDSSDYVILELEDIVEIAVETISPNLRYLSHLGDLGIDTHAFPGTAHASLDNVSDAQLRPDRAEIDLPSSIRQRMNAARLRSCPAPSKVGNQVFRQALGKGHLLRVVAEVSEREDGNRHMALYGSSCTIALRVRFHPIFIVMDRPCKLVADARHGLDPLDAVACFAQTPPERRHLDGSGRFLYACVWPRRIHQFSAGHHAAVCFEQHLQKCKCACSHRYWQPARQEEPPATIK